MMRFYDVLRVHLHYIYPQRFLSRKKHGPIPAADKNLDIIRHKNNIYLTKMGTPRYNFNITLDLSAEKPCSSSMRVPHR